MLHIITGRRASGKTLLATRMAKEQAELGMTVYANYPLDFPHRLLSSPRDLSNALRCKLAFVVIDDAHLWVGTRHSQQDLVRRLLAWGRRAGRELVLTTSAFNSLDKRLRSSGRYLYRCQREESNFLVDTQICADLLYSSCPALGKQEGN